jgi:CRP/FNR family transcriptional regulator, cyclic AMP receptor protein
MPRGVPRRVTEMLRAVPLFSTCSTPELRAIAALGTQTHVRSGEALTTQGKPGSEFFLVIAGTASCTVDGDNVAELGPGEFFGELALLTGAPRAATVTAETELDVLVLSRREFRSLLRESHRVSMKMLERLAERIRVLEEAHTH